MRPGHPADLHALHLVERLGLGGEEGHGHVIAQRLSVDPRERLPKAAARIGRHAAQGGIDIQRGGAGIGVDHGGRNHLVGVQRLKADVPACAHLHEDVFIVCGVKELEQEVLRGDGHVVSSDGDAAGLELLRAHGRPCRARIPLEDGRREGGIQPEHVGIEGGRSGVAAIDLFGVIDRSADLEGDIAGVLRDAGLRAVHASRQTVDVLGRGAPVRPCVQHLQLDIPKPDVSRHAVGRGCSEGEIGDGDGVVGRQVQRPVLQAHPVVVRCLKARVRGAQVPAAPDGFELAVLAVEVVHPQAGVHAWRGGFGGLHPLTADVQRNADGRAALAVREEIVRNREAFEGERGGLAVLVVAVGNEGKFAAAAQAVVAALVLFMDETRGRRHRRRNGLRGDFLLSGLHTCGKGIDLRLVRLERDGRVGLLKASAHLPTRLTDGDGSLIGHLRQRLERAVHEAVERVLRKHAGLVRAGERAQRHIGQAVVLGGNRSGQDGFRGRKDRAGQRARHIAGCANRPRKVRVNRAQRTVGVGQVELGAVHAGGHGGGSRAPAGSRQRVRRPPAGSSLPRPRRQAFPPEWPSWP